MKGETGYMVFEHCDDYEQALMIEQGPALPAGGVLDWRGKSDPAALFPDRQSAEAAIARTEHYRLAFKSNHPERKFCKVVRATKVQPPRQ